MSYGSLSKRCLTNLIIGCKQMNQNILQLESLSGSIYNSNLTPKELAAFEDFKSKNDLNFKGDLIKKAQEFYHWFLTNANGRDEYLTVGRMVHDYFSYLLFFIRNSKGRFHAILA